MGRAGSSRSRELEFGRDSRRERVIGYQALGTHWYLYLKMYGTKTPIQKFLVDTGAPMSVIKIKNLDLKKCNPRNQKIKSKVQIVNGTHEMMGTCELGLFNKKHKFKVAQSNFPLKEDGILGKDWLQSYEAIIDSKGETIEIKNNNNNMKFKFNKEPKIIPPKQILTVKMKTKKENGDYLYEHENVITGIYKIKENKINLFLINESSEEKYVYKNDLKITEYNEKLQDKITHMYKMNNFDPNNIIRIKKLKENSRLQHLQEEHRTEILKIILEFSDIFCLKGEPTPCVTDVTHKIELDTKMPIAKKLYRHPLTLQKEISKQLKEFEEKKIIEPSNSPFLSPVWCVPKKMDASGTQKWRVVIDFRKLNEHTLQDNYPLPNIEEIMDQLGKAKLFSAFDLASGFYQIPMHPEDKYKTAFSTHEGHWHFNRMPMGLKNAPATFQRMMNLKLQGLVGNICFVYLDDIIIYSKTFEEHLKNLKILFERLRQVGLKLQPVKCEYLKPDLEYLGHLITEEGVKPNPKKTDAIKNFPEPKNQKQIKQFLGLAEYYRKFIKNFVKIAEPFK